MTMSTPERSTPPPWRWFCSVEPEAPVDRNDERGQNAGPDRWHTPILDFSDAVVSGFSRTPVGPPEGGHYGPMKSAVVRRAGPWAESFQNRQSVAKSVIRQAANSLPVQVLPACMGIAPWGPMVRFLVTFALMLPIAACTKSPTSPSGDGASGLLRGQTVSAVDGSASPNLSVRIGERTVTSDGNGMFEMEMGSSGTVPLRRSRQRRGRAGDPHFRPGRGAREGLPHSVDLRSPGVRRDVPHVELPAPAMDVEARARRARLGHGLSRRRRHLRSDGRAAERGRADADGPAADRRPRVSHGRYLHPRSRRSTSSVRRRGRESARSRSGKIVVGRYNGIATFARTIGYGQWSALADGSISGGATFLDRDFDRNDSRRRLLRDPRARPCARIPARRDADLDHEPGDRTRAERLRSHRFDHRLPASGGKSIS